MRTWLTQIGDYLYNLDAGAVEMAFKMACGLVLGVVAIILMELYAPSLREVIPGP
jgi:hypothetical protein